MTALKGSTLRKASEFAGKLLRGLLIVTWVLAGPTPVAFASVPGYYLAGDGSGGGGGGDYPYDYGWTPNGGAGGGASDVITGTVGDDVIFGDGSGGGGGGEDFRNGWGGAAGGGSDAIDGGAGNDVIFGDGFAGGPRNGVNGGPGGFGGGGGGGGAWQPDGTGGTGGILGGGGGGQAGSAVGVSLWGGMSGGVVSKPASGSSSDDNNWGGNSATPTAGDGWFSDQSLGGTGYNVRGAGGGAGFGGVNSQSQPIAGSVTRYANGGQFGGSGQSGSTSPVQYSDSTGALWSYVYGQRANIFSATTGTVYAVGAGADTIDGGPGSDELYGLGGNDTFVIDRDEASASDTDTVWDLNRLGESDKLSLYLSGRLIRSGELTSILASQTQPSNHSDRTIVFSDGGSHSVTVVVKAMGRNLYTSDFNAAANSAPSVATSLVADVTSATASCGGGVTDDGGASVTARGVCWSTSANPTVSGSKTTDASGTGSFSSSITGLSPHTRYHVRAYATNSVGTGYGDDVSFYYDDAGPVTTASGLAGTASTGWRSTSASVSFSATDPLSGVAYTQYAVDTSEWTTYATGPVSVGGTEGSHTVFYRSADASGNVESTNTGYVNIDSVTPTLTVSAPSGWQVSSPVTVSASAIDTMSGVAGIRYAVGNGAAATYTAEVPVLTQGTTTLSFSALDLAGNTTASQTVNVRLDSVAPTTTASGLADAPGTWRTSALLFSLSATDAASGVAATTYTVDSGVGQLYATPVSVTGEGTHTVTYASIDAAGNVEATNTGYVGIDQTAPRTTDDHSEVYTGPATIHLSVVDTLSGPAQTAYVLDSGEVALGTTITASAAGAHTLEYASTDEAGNVESTHTITFTVAKTSYSTKLKLSGAWSVRRLATYTLGIRIVPSEATGTVGLKYQRKVSGVWRTIKNGSVALAGGTASYSCRFGQAGTWRVIATYGGSSTASSIYGATSTTRPLTVR
jgi:hypothetical protein